MTTYNFTQLSNNQSVTISSAEDVIHFNINKSAGDVFIDRSVSNRTAFTVNGKTIIVEGNMWRLEPSNFLFDGGGEVLIGDRTSNYSNDAIGQTITGTSGGDLIYGGAGADTLVGGAGSDTIFCGALPDSNIDVVSYLSSPRGIDAVFYTESLDAHVADGWGGTDYIRYVDSLLGSNYGDAINFGGGGLSLTSLKLYGGSDTIYVSTGHSKLIDGGNGMDTLNYAAIIYSLELGASHQISANLGDGRVYDAFGRSVSVRSIENVVGTAYADRITGSDANNKLIGNEGNDLLVGGAGGDTLSGGSGADSLVGGDGSDLYYVDNAGDKVVESNASSSTGGIDTVYSYLASCVLAANVENARIVTSGAANLTGNGLANLIYAGAGVNVMDGGAGSDTLSYAYATSSGTSGVTVTLSTSTTATTVSGISGADQIKGFENLIGSKYADRLTGSTANNILNGGAGNDVLIGGLGKDSLTGGTGNDIFDVNALTETGVSSSTWDVITDFVRGQDRIDLSTLDANTALSGNNAFTQFIAGTAAFTAAGQLKFSGGVLYGNTDADATAEFAIQLTGVTSLSVADCVL